MTADAIDRDSERYGAAEVVEPRTAAAEDADYRTARRFLTLLQTRQQQFRESRGRAVDFSQVRGGRVQHRGPQPIAPLEQWIINVGWLLGSLGHKGAYVLTARVTRRPKSAEASWKRIAAEVEDTVEEVKRIYAYALCAFILLLEMNRVSTDLRDDMPSAHTHGVDRCASAEKGRACAVMPAA